MALRSAAAPLSQALRKTALGTHLDGASNNEYIDRSSGTEVEKWMLQLEGTESVLGSQQMEEEPRRKAQDVECGVHQSCVAFYQSIAIRIFSYLDNSEALKVSTNELKEQVLSPNEPSVTMERIVRQARSEKPHEICGNPVSILSSLLMMT